MSLKDKANAIREHGAAERGNYTPAKDSLPLRMYNYWRNLDPERAPKTENFCHYWRVVLFWAPLWWVLEHLIAAVDSKVGRVVAVVTLVAAVIALISMGGSAAWGIVGVVLAIAYGIVTLLFGLIAGATRGEFSDLIKDTGWKPFIFMPLALIPFGMVYGPRLLWDKLDYGVKDKIKSVATITAAGIFGLALIAVLGLALFHDPMSVLLVFLVAVGLVAAFMGLSFLSDYLKMKHQAARDARTTVKIEDWGYGMVHEVKVVEPSKIAKFFMHIGDFLNLAYQAVRVKKWKICPIVQIPTDN